MSLAWIRRVPGVRTTGNRLKRMWWAVSRRELFPPGHYYSPTPDDRWIRGQRGRLFDPAVTEIPGIDLRLDAQRSLLAEFASFQSEFDVAEQPTAGRRYFADNPFFGRGSAFNLYAMLRRFSPQRVIEVGSGFSSAVMLDTNERELKGRMSLTFIEPNPQRLYSLLRNEDDARTRIVTQPVQDVSLELFDELAANDLLFIDSSHITKIGSDVNHLLFEVLPRLQPGVLVHFHDITWPFEYPERWLNEGRFWNEAYILRAFLQFNSAFEIVLFDDYFTRCESPFFERTLPQCPGGLGASLWIRRVGSPSAERVA